MEAQTKSVANRVSTILIVVVLCFASLVGCAAEGSDKSSGVPVQDNQAGSEVEQEGPSPAKYDSPVVFSFPDVFYLQSEDLQQSLSSYASFQVQGSDEVFITTDAVSDKSLALYIFACVSLFKTKFPSSSTTPYPVICPVLSKWKP